MLTRQPKPGRQVKRQQSGQNLLYLLIFFCSVGFTQGLQISEVMSANATGITDNYGVHSDWIELHNSSAQTINLDGYGLSDKEDNPLKWTFPELYLGADEYLLVFASDRDETWLARLETVIDKGASWHYWPGTSAPPSNWMTPDFDASSWRSGASGFGFGDDDDSTVLAPVTSVFVRSTFSFNPERADGVLVHIDYDDGYALYINGREISRRFLPRDAAFDTPATRGREAGLYRGQPALMNIHWLDSDDLVSGTNTIAIEAHTRSVDNSTEPDWVEAADLSLTPFVSLWFNPDTVPADVKPASTELWYVLPKLHTNFKLSQQGETLTLSTPDGNPVDSVTLDAMAADVSQGRAAATWQYMARPTPGWANAPGLLGQVPAPTITTAASRYGSTISVRLGNSDPNSSLHYTLDGATPGADDPIYSSALSIANSTVLRVRAFRTGYLPSETVTHSYLIADPSRLPVVSLTTDSANLWDEATGIYVAGLSAEPDYRETNYHQRWTRPAHAELFEPDGTLGFSVDVGLELFGGSARRHPRKSFEIMTSGEYGSGKFDYPVFPGYGVTSFENLILRSSSNDWQQSLFRDALAQSLLAEAGLATHAYRPAVLYVNGAYWGIYNIREKMDARYLEKHYGVDTDNVDLIEGFLDDDRLDGEIKSGSLDALEDLISYVRTHDLSNPANYATVAEQIDIANFVTYSAAQIYIDNEDWPGRNVRLWRSTTPGSQWRWLVYDLDFAFGLRRDASADTLSNILNEGVGAYGEDWSEASLLLRELLKNADFRAQFIRTMDTLSTGIFAADHVAARVDSMAAKLEPEIARHLQRWGESQWLVKTPDDWHKELEKIKTFARQRPAYIEQHLIAQFGQAEVTRARSSADDAPLEFRTHVSPGELFTQASPSKLVINEINYHSAEDSDSEDWVELYNAGTTTLDLGGWQLRDAQDDTPFTLPEGTTLAAGGYLVLCRDSDLFADIHAIRCLGNWDFGLKGGGEAVRLFSPDGTLIDALSYSDEAPWPTAADGTGATLELLEPGLDNALAESWAASVFKGGTPGRANSTLRSGTN